jgi:hypothetical protein
MLPSSWQDLTLALRSDHLLVPEERSALNPSSRAIWAGMNSGEEAQMRDSHTIEGK